MARKEPKRKKVGTTKKGVSKARRKAIIIETVIVIVIIGLFIAGVTKIVVDEMHGKRPFCPPDVQVSPTSFISIVT